MNEDLTSTEQQNTLPAFHCRENGMCPGSQGKRMRDWEKKGSANAYAIWSEWLVPEAD